MPDFVAVKELVEQQIDFYRCSGASLVQALCIQRPLQALLGKNVSKPRPWMSCCASVIELCSLITVQKELKRAAKYTARAAAIVNSGHFADPPIIH